MAGKGKAVHAGDNLVQRVVALAHSLGLETKEQFKAGRRVWGAERAIDVVLIEKSTRKILGIECKFQAGPGSADEKIPTTIKDIEVWPIPGLVVLDGGGFSPNMRSYLISTGKAVEFQDLENWLRLFFGLGL